MNRAIATATLLYTKNMSIVTRAPLSANQKRWIVKRITLNHKYNDIIREFEEKFDRRINSATIMRLKQRHLGAITQGQAQLVETGAIQAASLQQQSYRLLQRKMDRAEAHETDIQRLKRQYRDGEIEYDTLKRALETYEQLTVTELTNIANAAHAHSKGHEDDAPTPADAAAMHMLVEGIRSGNPVQLVQILNPTINNGGNQGA